MEIRELDYSSLSRQVLPCQICEVLDLIIFYDKNERTFTIFCVCIYFLMKIRCPQTMNSSCFNTLCPGFILVRSDYPVDQVLEPVSHSGGPLYIYRFFIYRVSKFIIVFFSFLPIPFFSKNRYTTYLNSSITFFQSTFLFHIK